MKGSAAQVGRIVVRRTAGTDGAEHRRIGAARTLEIERTTLPLAFTRAQTVAIAISLFLTTALLVLSIAATASPPGIWIAPILVIAGAAFVGHQRSRRSVIRVDAKGLTALRSGQREHVALEDIEGLGVGREHPYRTLWVRVRGRGRVLMLDGLSPEEADLASRSLRAVIDGHGD